MHSGGGVLSVSLKLADEAFPMMLGGRPAVFSERDQALHELNDSAAGLLARLAAPTDLTDFRCEFDNLIPSSDESRQIAEDLLVDWSEKGIIDARVDWEARAAGLPLFLPSGDGDIEIRMGGDDFGRRLSAPYRHLPATGKPLTWAAAAVVDGLAFIQIEGQATSIVPPAQGGPKLRFGLVNALLRSRRLIALHAACFVVDHEAVLVAASPGAGKSTLTFSLARSGFSCAGDDIVMFDPRSGLVFAVPLPFTLKEGSWRLLAPEWPELEEFPAEKRADAVWVRYLPMHSAPHAAWFPVRAIIGLDRNRDHEAELSTWPKMDCLRKLYGEAYSAEGRSSLEDLQAMIALVEQAQTHMLCYSEASEAARLLERHFVG